MTTKTAPPAPAIEPRLLLPSEALATILPMLTRARGDLRLSCRSLGGYGFEQPTLPHGTSEIPVHLFELLADGDEIRAEVVTRTAVNGPPADLPAAFVMWRPKHDFDARTAHKRIVLPAEQERIRATLAAAPIPPSLLIDGGHELVGVWPLDRPADCTRDLATVRELLASMARTLDADPTAAEGFSEATLPIAGPVRSWGADPDRIAVYTMSSETFTLEALQAAFVTKEGNRK